jgi:hypothetical protein
MDQETLPSMCSPRHSPRSVPLLRASLLLDKRPVDHLILILVIIIISSHPSPLIPRSTTFILIFILVVILVIIRSCPRCGDSCSTLALGSTSSSGSTRITLIVLVLVRIEFPYSIGIFSIDLAAVECCSAGYTV